MLITPMRHNYVPGGTLRKKKNNPQGNTGH